MDNEIFVGTDSPKVEVTIPNQGTLTGFTLKNPANGKLTAKRFARIPYALPLKKRFTLPEPIPDDYDYTGEYKDFGFKCPQPVYESKQIVYPKSESTNTFSMPISGFLLPININQKMAGPF